MTMSKSIENRILAGTAALGISAALAAGGAGLAHAGTVPARPGEPTVAMTLTNHTNHTEWLVSATPGTGQWVQAPTRALAPGASETIVSAAPAAHTRPCSSPTGSAPWDRGRPTTSRMFAGTSTRT